MQLVNVINKSNPLEHPLHANYCRTFLCRLRGLMFQKPLNVGKGLLIDQEKEGKISASIHMFGVSFNIAVVWINSSYQVVDVRRAIKWYSLIVPSYPARYVLEIAEERVADFRQGDIVGFEAISN